MRAATHAIVPGAANFSISNEMTANRPARLHSGYTGAMACRGIPMATCRRVMMSLR